MLVLTTLVTIRLAPHSELWPYVLVGGPESGIKLLEMVSEMKVRLAGRAQRMGVASANVLARKLMLDLRS
ncbi:hypothetical protein IFM46972_01668 [Aspergillus udagawae]|uniref:Uncharacterized protein n=1 Tax=Aspergillus udagawae TaxID=91492 RepID=A0A8H3NBI7_9EURO|nr:hypothetical protein IFM46972_01668 [Aspergillus udagawae]